MVDLRSRQANETTATLSTAENPNPSPVADHDFSTYTNLWALPPSPPLVGSDRIEDHSPSAAPGPSGSRSGEGPVEYAALSSSLTEGLSASQRPSTTSTGHSILSTTMSSSTKFIHAPAAMPTTEYGPSQDFAAFDFGAASTSASLAAAQASPFNNTNGTLSKDFDNGSSLALLFSSWVNPDHVANPAADSDLPFDVSPFSLDFPHVDTASSSSAFNMDDYTKANTTDPLYSLFNDSAFINPSTFRPTENEVQARAQQFDSLLESPLGDSPRTFCMSDFDTSPVWGSRALSPGLNQDMGNMSLPESDPIIGGDAATESATPELVADREDSPKTNGGDDEEEEAEVVDEEDSDEYKPVKKGSRKRKAPSASATPEPRAQRTFNGTRKVPLIGLDAPIQKRNYKGDSKTARKVLPINIAKSLKRDVAEGEDELDDDAMAKIAASRSKNTLSARITRQRKAQHLAELEDKVVSQADLIETQVNEIQELKKRLAVYERV